MKTRQTKQKHCGLSSPGNWRWIAMLALLACLMASRATAGTLTIVSVVKSPVATQFNLSAEGDLDWAHWRTFNITDYDHKAGVTSLIPTWTQYGGGTMQSYTGDNQRFSWLDGTVDQVIAGNSGGNYINGTGNGFTLTIPASTTTTYLHLYVGSFQSPAQLELSLSDGSAASISNTVSISDRWNRFTVAFAANSAGQTLTVNYYGGSPSSGNVTLLAASLSSAEPLPFSVPQPRLSGGSSLKTGSTFYVQANPKGVNTNGQSQFSYQWQVDNGSGYVDVAGGTNASLYATAGSAGTYNYRVVVSSTVLAGGPVTSAPATVTVTTPTGTLSASGADLPPAGPPTFTPLDVNLTAEGGIDWGHWGLVNPTDYDYKNGTLGNFTQIGAGAPVPFSSSVSFSWTDATTPNNPVSATTSGVGLPVDNGFELNIPAATTNRLVHIYVGANNAFLNVTATLSDNSAPLFTDNPTITTGTRRYSIVFSAATAGQTLKVRLTETTRAANGGSISLLSASLRPVPALSVSALTVDRTAVLVNQPVVVSLAPFDPQGAPPFTYQWRRNTGSGLTNVPGATGRSLSFTAGSTVGSESCDVVITGSQGSITSAPVTLTRSLATGLLTILNKDIIPGANNLTLEGGIDWSHWGADGALGLDQKAIGGTPVNIIGDYIAFGPGSINAYGGASSFSWSDGTPNLALTNNRGIYHNNFGNGFQLNVGAATTNRVLHVYLGSFQANTHVEAYLSDNSALKVIDETMPNGQARRWNLLFAAGSPGATLIFRYWDLSSGGNVTLMAASLEKVPLLAVGTPTVGPASTVSVGSSIYLDAQGANGLPPLQYQWQVDTGGGYVVIPSSNAAHLPATAGVIGNINYRVVVSDINGSITSAPVALTVTAATSTLVASSTPVAVGTAQTTDLTAEGLIDWAQWGLGGVSGYEQKFPLAGQISQYSIIGTGPVFGYGGNGIHCVWADGTPDATGDTVQGVYINNAPNGFELTAEATAYERVFNLYCTVFQSTMHVEATMSDGSAPIFIDESLTGGSSTGRRYSFRYSSPTPGRHLIVRWWNLTGANITINAATLTYGPNNLQVQPVGGGQLRVTWPIGTLLQAPTVTGPWTTNVATSPYTFTPTGTQKYFRAIIQ